jgi:hypothetical protein
MQVHFGPVTTPISGNHKPAFKDLGVIVAVVKKSISENNSMIYSLV